MARFLLYSVHQNVRWGSERGVLAREAPSAKEMLKLKKKSFPNRKSTLPPLHGTPFVPGDPESTSEDAKAKNLDTQLSHLSSDDALMGEEENEEVKIEELEGKSLGYFDVEHPLRVALWNLVISNRFEMGMFFLIMCSCFNMACERPGIEVEWNYYMDITLSVFFTGELVMKVLVYGLVLGPGTPYLRDNWNQLDAVIVLVSWMGIILNAVGVEGDQVLAILRVLRAVRPLRVISRSSKIQLVVASLVFSLTSMVHVFTVCFLFFLIFGILGVQLFAGSFYFCDSEAPTPGNVTWYDEEGVASVIDVADVKLLDRVYCNCDTCSWENAYLNFDSVPAGLLALYVVSALDGWVDLFTAIIIENFEELEQREQWPVTESQMQEMHTLWSDLASDQESQEHISVRKLYRLMDQLPPPLGVAEFGEPLNLGRCHAAKVLQRLRNMDLEVVEHRVLFFPTLYAFTATIAQHELPKGEQRKQIHAFIYGMMREARQTFQYASRLEAKELARIESIGKRQNQKGAKGIQKFKAAVNTQNVMNSLTRADSFKGVEQGYIKHLTYARYSHISQEAAALVIQHYWEVHKQKMKAKQEGRQFQEQLVKSTSLIEKMTGQIVDLPWYWQSRQIEEEDELKGIGLKKEPVLQRRRRTQSSKNLSKLNNPLQPTQQEGRVGDVRRKLFKLIHSNGFDAMIMSCIILNTVAMMVVQYEQSYLLTSILYHSNLVFTGVFIVEAVVKIAALNPKVYWRFSGWNRFDFILVLTSIMDLAISFVSASFLRILRVGRISRISRITRIMRVTRLTRGVTGVKQLFATLVVSVSGFWSVGSLLVLVFFIYAYMGVGMFGRVAHGDNITEHANFEHFGWAVLTLVRVATGEAWVGLMEDVERNGCDDTMEGSGACG
eukprot:gene5079-6183_t